MRLRLLSSPVLILASVLWPASVRATDAGPAAPAVTSTQAPSGPTHAAPQPPAPKPAAQPAKPKPKPQAKPPAKPPPKGAVVKKKPRAPGAPHEADPAARRAVAGVSPTGTKTTGIDTPEVSALRQADHELFGLQPAPLPLRSTDALPAPSAESDRPVVFASGLPPPVAAASQPADAAPTDAEWLASLSQPDLSIRWNARVVRYLTYYKNDPRGRAVASSWFKKSGTYDALLRRTLRSNNLPEDLIWVSLVESGFNPLAYSGAGAAGLWQFMPGTARLYGLVVDRWIDERLDPERSTDAAAKFLSDLYTRFGTWELALAAYNMGFGGLLSAVRKYNTNDFWELSRFESGLPWETTLYVPKITALAIVARNPGVFGLDGLVRETPVAFETVDVPPGVPLSTVASAAGVEVDKVEQLNPQLLLSRTPPQTRPGASMWSVRVPVGGAAKFAKNIVRVRAQDPQVERYLVRYGDSLPDIARSRGVTVKALAALNSLDPDDVPQPGTVLLMPPLPKTERAGEKPIVMVAADLQAPAGYRRLFYRVLAGDTVPAVADAFGVTVDDLRRWNLLDPIARLQEGMSLMLMVPVTRDVTGLPARGDQDVRVLVVGTDRFFDHHESLRDRVRTTVVARPNETWQQLAQRTGMSVGQLERINRRSRHTRLEAGERLIAYVPAKMAPGAKPAAARPVESEEPAAPPCPDDLPPLPSADQGPGARPTATGPGSGA
ncbi:MAG: transglycosylase SLT domain-containing protein [Deltaproteobacteria bacterium]|nr:transglycosylase SLT domain-containing protein [Deltaproteobacteria bacterium]